MQELAEVAVDVVGVVVVVVAEVEDVVVVVVVGIVVAGGTFAVVSIACRDCAFVGLGFVVASGLAVGILVEDSASVDLGGVAAVGVGGIGHLRAERVGVEDAGRFVRGHHSGVLTIPAGPFGFHS